MGGAVRTFEQAGAQVEEVRLGIERDQREPSDLDLSRDQQTCPVGMQLIGRRHADADVLAASAAFERIRPWQDSYRLCAERPR